MCSPLPGAFSFPPPPPALAAEAGLLFPCEVVELARAGRTTFLLASEIGGIEGALCQCCVREAGWRGLEVCPSPGSRFSSEQHLCTALCCLQRIPLTAGERWAGKPDAKSDLQNPS